MGSEFEREVNQWERLLTGEERGVRYKNSNLYIRPQSAQTIQQRTKKDICPPTRLNQDYHEPTKKLRRSNGTCNTSSRKAQRSRQVDSEFLNEIRYG